MDVTGATRQQQNDETGPPLAAETPPVKVPRAVYDGIAAVRGSGLTTMLNRAVVTDLADFYGFDEAASWVRSHWREYAKGLCLGFDPTD